ncbi:thioredoxin [Hymenobacter rigui]|uniref:Thioredoxin n=1 Tax=Hymenobacter rigui TaxID=334424 RepID=A0A3R9MTX4_9BACT|nr:thioredoxin [Hymenobacter rigui]RSK50009.1 thioredoxin [Hymenobacter rigui]
MPAPLLASPNPTPPAAAMLLVMMPPAAARPGPAGPYFSATDQSRLQHLLGAGVQVLRIDEAEYPAVVRSFAPPRLPACVLLWQGMELWRQEGLPQPELVAPIIQARLQAVAVAVVCPGPTA